MLISILPPMYPAEAEAKGATPGQVIRTESQLPSLHVDFTVKTIEPDLI